MKQFVESKCDFTFEGRTFSSSGAWLLKNLKTRLYEGLLYRYPNGLIGDWKGTFKIPYTVTNTWISNMGCKRQSIRFTYLGKHFYGIQYSMDWSDIIHVRELKSNS